VSRESYVLVVTAAVVERDGRFLITRRQDGVHLEGYWEFPGGKLEPGESHADGLRREMREELDADVVVGAKILAVSHAYDDRTVELHFYQCDLAGQPVPRLGQEMRWVTRGEMRALRFPPADEALIAQLVAG
jgi:8-oxo-dGTP diphosphatase